MNQGYLKKTETMVMGWYGRKVHYKLAAARVASSPVKKGLLATIGQPDRQKERFAKRQPPTDCEAGRLGV